MSQKPHLLMITPYLPYPPVSGGRMRTYYILKYLKQDFDITLICYGRPEELALDITPLGEVCDYHVVERDGSPSTIQAAIMSLTSPRSITMRLYDTPQMKDKIRAVLAEKPAKIIHVESFYMLQNVPQDVGVPVFLSEPAIEYRAWGQYARVAKPFYTRPGILIEALKMRLTEPKWWAKADAVGAMSDVDAQIIKKVAPDATVYLAPNGVDVDFFAPAPDVQKDTRTAVFMGDYKYFPNTDAVRYFVDEIMPLIVSKKPDFHLTLLGKDPTPDMLALSGEHVTITGMVDDTRPYLYESALFICPLRSGSGTRFKLMEALACGCAVVSTSIGAEGLNAVDGEQMLLRDTPESFAQAVVDLLNNPERVSELGRKGREWVVPHHGWAHSTACLKDAYSALLGNS
jgi:glycosyltransferase involved in cell wall biosynthesis